MRRRPSAWWNGSSPAIPPTAPTGPRRRLNRPLPGISRRTATSRGAGSDAPGPRRRPPRRTDRDPGGEAQGTEAALGLAGRRPARTGAVVPLHQGHDLAQEVRAHPGRALPAVVPPVGPETEQRHAGHDDQDVEQLGQLLHTKHRRPCGVVAVAARQQVEGGPAVTGVASLPPAGGGRAGPRGRDRPGPGESRVSSMSRSSTRRSARTRPAALAGAAPRSDVPPALSRAAPVSIVRRAYVSGIHVLRPRAATP